jgi:hypothetical protein
MDIIDRIWAGRGVLTRMRITTDLNDVEIIMSVDTHMRLMAGRSNPAVASAIEVDHKLPVGIRIFGLVVRRDPTFAPNEIRFRSEISL